MTDTKASLLGQQNLSGSDTALFLKQFSGEVMTTYTTENKFEALVRAYTISSGKSFQFPAIGEAQAAYHIRGEDIYDPTNNYLNSIEIGERVVNVDRPLLASVFVDSWEEMINHFEVASTFSTELGKALAKAKDRVLLQLITKAARDLATLTATQSATKGGLVLTDAAMDSSVTTFKSKVLAAMQALVTKDVPMNELVLAVKPKQYYELMDNGDLINLDFGGAGNGSKAEGTIYKAYGFRIVMTNNMPTGLISSPTGARNDYGGDFSKTVALAFHPSCIGTVRRQGVAIEREYSVAHQGDLVVAKFIEGHGVLRPECAVELAIA